MTTAETRLISPEQTYPLRQSVLRPGRPISECLNDEDFLPSTFHVGTFAENHLMVIATLMEQTPPSDLLHFLKRTDLTKFYRLRGMATDPAARMQGYGRKNLKFAEHHLRDMHVDFLWFNARKIAFPFYTSLGYQFFGDEFEMKHIGPHKVMYKILKSDSL